MKKKIRASINLGSLQGSMSQGSLPSMSQGSLPSMSQSYDHVNLSDP